MSRERSIFFDEWQACLRSHYIHVIRNQDEVTEPTLRHVLLHTGLTQEELETLWEEVNYTVPQAESVEEPAATIDPEEAVMEAAAEPVEEPLPAEVIEVVAAEVEKTTAELIVETGTVGDGMTIAPETESAVEPEATEDAPPEETPPPPPDVRQLSLF